MKLDLTEIAVNLGKRIKYDIDEPPITEFDGTLTCVSPIKGEVTFTNSGRHIVVRGKFKTTVELDCTRCLRAFRMNLDLPIEEEFLIPGHVAELPEEDIEEEEVEAEAEPIFVDNLFDLTELIRQSILVAVPIKTLCFEECKGLCPHCGKNLNDGPCECPPDQDPGPFAVLESLIEEDESEEES